MHCKLKSKSKHDGVKISDSDAPSRHLESAIVNEKAVNFEEQSVRMDSEDAKRNSFKAAKTAFQKLKIEWSKSPPNLDVCGQLLTELKVFSLLVKIPISYYCMIAVSGTITTYNYYVYIGFTTGTAILTDEDRRL